VGALDGKVAFISGAARGQGRSHAVRLASEGANIIGVDMPGPMRSVGYPMATRADFDETVRAVEAVGGRMLAFAGDVRDSAAMREAVDSGVEEFGRLDIVLANAGIGSFAPAEEMTDEVWDEMIDINLTGAFRTVRPAIRHLKRQGGSIVFTGSVAALRGIRNLAHYTAAKHGLVGLTKSLAIELAPHQIRVNAVHPTNVDTDLIHNEPTYRLFLPDRDPSTVTREDVAPIFANSQPLGIPWLQPSDVSDAILFLVSSAGRYITGISLPVDAGNLIR
jgi:SDR family mycofactocin-dependent oxidoreductase